MWRLALNDPLVLVGDFFRPNLHLRVAARRDALADVLEVILRRPGQAGIVYTIRQADVDDLAQGLHDSGVRAVGYHAGLEESSRARAQDQWMAGEVELIVATVAFGMGIDRRDVRYVIHAAMPQSLEHYQQEAGRAGRDGNEAECVLFWSPGDVKLWHTLIEAQNSSEATAKKRLVTEMHRFCAAATCRHRALVEYFGQKWNGDSCGACDVCDGNARSGPHGSPARPMPLDRGLYERLRRVRREIADTRSVPANAIAADSALREMAASRPATLGELRRIGGMGRSGLAPWGTRFLAAIREHGF